MKSLLFLVLVSPLVSNAFPATAKPVDVCIGNKYGSNGSRCVTHSEDDGSRKRNKKEEEVRFRIMSSGKAKYFSNLKMKLIN